MTSAELENLIRIGKLKREPPSRREFDGLLLSGTARLTDAANTELALESRFDLAYNASHALALAALRRLGIARGIATLSSRHWHTRRIFLRQSGESSACVTRGGIWPNTRASWT